MVSTHLVKFVYIEHVPSWSRVVWFARGYSDSVVCVYVYSCMYVCVRMYTCTGSRVDWVSVTVLCVYLCVYVCVRMYACIHVLDQELTGSPVTAFFPGPILYDLSIIKL